MKAFPATAKIITPKWETDELRAPKLAL